MRYSSCSIYFNNSLLLSLELKICGPQALLESEEMAQRNRRALELLQREDQVRLVEGMEDARVTAARERFDSKQEQGGASRRRVASKDLGFPQ